MRGALARYETVYRDEPIEAPTSRSRPGSPSTTPSGWISAATGSKSPKPNGLAATSVRFRAGWVASDSPDTPDKVDVSADRRDLRAGRAPPSVHIVAPFAGHATLLTLTDRVHTLRDIEVPAERHRRSTCRSTPSWGPGAYVDRARLPRRRRRPSGPRDRPRLGRHRPGLAHARRLGVACRTRCCRAQRITVPAARPSPAPGSRWPRWMRACCGLTDFDSPDPVGALPRPPAARARHPRRLGPADPARRGRGDRAAPGRRRRRRRAAGDPAEDRRAVHAAGAGRRRTATVQVPLDLPDFNGQVRLMAVAWQGNRDRRRRRRLIVRDPMIAEPLLPRFLAPGDEARLAVLMQNLDLPAGRRRRAGLGRGAARDRRRDPARRHARPRRAGGAARRRCARPASGGA